MPKHTYYYECSYCRGTVVRTMDSTSLKGAAGAAGGGASGAVAGAVIGSIIPVAGTLAGAVIGGALGAGAGGAKAALGPAACVDCGASYRAEDVSLLRPKAWPTNLPPPGSGRPINQSAGPPSASAPSVTSSARMRGPTYRQCVVCRRSYYIGVDSSSNKVCSQACAADALQKLPQVALRALLFMLFLIGMFVSVLVGSITTNLSGLLAFLAVVFTLGYMLRKRLNITPMGTLAAVGLSILLFMSSCHARASHHAGTPGANLVEQHVRS